MIESVGEMATERLELRMWTTLKKVSSNSIQTDKFSTNTASTSSTRLSYRN